MNPVNPRVLLHAMFFMCLYPGSALAREGVKSDASLTCTGVINTRVVSALSIDEISKLGDAYLQNNFGGLAFQPRFDDDRLAQTR